MIFEYIDAQNKRETISITKEYVSQKRWIYLQTGSKLEFIKEFLPRYNSQERLVLFDANHKQLLDFYNANDINKIEGIEQLPQDMKLLFFTSGSSGFPVGAFKTRSNLESEVQSLKKIVAQRTVKKVIVTVPFVHIYGILAGLLLPLALGDIKLVVKEDFLPYELLEEAKEPDSLVVTTPVFIKALAKLPESESLGNTLFISSTAPLSQEDVALFCQKYETDIIQLFGSTETGGIAYKRNTSLEWTPLDGVEVATQSDKLNVRSPFVSNYLLKETLQRVVLPYQTEDIVEVQEGRFQLIGRSNKLIKIAGKRISALQIEKILEEIAEIQKAIVELVYKKELLRSEQIVITLEATKKVEKRVIKEKIAQYYGIITIPFNLKYVEQINYSAMGKKVIF